MTRNRLPHSSPFWICSVGVWLGLGGLIPSVLGATPPTWELETRKEIGWYATAPGMVVVATETMVRGLDQEDGSERWSFQVKKLDGDRFDIVPYTPYALVSFKKKMRGDDPVVALIDVTTGEDLWTSEQNGLARSFGSFLVPPASGLLVYGEPLESDKNVLTLLDLETGRAIWTTEEPFLDWPPELFGEGAQPPLFDTENTAILFLNGRSLRKYDLRDGRLVWETPDLKRATRGGILHALDGDEPEEAEEPEPAPLIQHGWAPMVFSADRDRVYAPHHNTVGAFSTHNGAALWFRPEILSGFPVQLERVAQGVLVRTIPSPGDDSGFHWITLLDSKTGRKLWRSPRGIIGGWSCSSPFVIHRDQLVVAADRKLLSLDWKSGREKKLCDLKFEGLDAPYLLERRNDGWLVIGEQNAVWCDLEGNIRERLYYRSPDGFSEGFLSLALAGVVNLVGEVRVGGGTVTLSADYAPAFAEMLRDYRATAEGLQYIYVLADSPDGPELVRIAKSGAEERGRVRVGTKEPDYQVCPYTGHLFWKAGDKKISCFTFQ